MKELTYLAFEITDKAYIKFRFSGNEGIRGGMHLINTTSLPFSVCRILKTVAQTKIKAKPSCYPTAAVVDKLTRGLTAHPAGLMWDLENDQNKLENKHLPLPQFS